MVSVSLLPPEKMLRDDVQNREAFLIFAKHWCFSGGFWPVRRRAKVRFPAIATHYRGSGGLVVEEVDLNQS